MENKAHALVAGIFAIVLILAGVAAIWWFGGKRESTVDYLIVTRQNVSGLNLQAQVRYRGIRVGRVESVRLDPDDDGNILIRISVNDDIPITEGTIAKLGYQGLTGIAHILLEDKGNDRRRLDRSRGLPRIPMKASMLQELSEAGGATLRQAQILLTSINELLNAENKARVGKTLANLESSSANLSATLADTRALLADPRLKQLGSMVANLDGASADARVALREVAVLVPRLNALAEKVDLMIGETNGEGLAASSVRLQELGREMTQTSRQLTRTLQALEDAPQSMLFGPPPAAPGPGEPGFVPPAVLPTTDRP
jgi:phospholipid/cholesterol/gamma-HCH transport system substrate-binding protein